MERNNFIDYAKALSIVFVVFIHTGFSALNNIVLFAMPLFFAATGYTFSIGKRSLGQNIRLRFRSVMLPYFSLMLFYALLEMLRAKLFSYGDARVAYAAVMNTAYGSGIIPFGSLAEGLKEIMSYKSQPQAGLDLILPSNCHLWFLPAMFTAFIIFVLLVKHVRKNHILKAAAVLCLILFASAEVVLPELCQLPLGLGRGAMGAAFMLFGFWLRDYRLLENKSVGYYIVSSVFALAAFIGALHLGSDGSAFVVSYYGPYSVWSVFITFIGGAAGVWLVLLLCKGLEALPFSRLKGLMSYMGRNVMTVYSWHMAVKFLFDVIYICIIKKSDFTLLDGYKMGLMPEESMCFMIFEAFSVIVICLLWSKVKNKLKLSAKVK